MSFTAETRERTRPVLPLAAMIDVLFLLLIFFMTASVFRDQELQIDVSLPAANTAQMGSGIATEVPIAIQEDNTIYLGQREMTVPELRSELTEWFEASPDDTVVIRGARKSDYGLFIELTDLAREVGFNDVQAAVVKQLEEQ